MKKSRVYNEVESLIDKIYKNKIINRYFQLIIGLLLSAIAFNIIYLPFDIVAGGLSGIAIIVDYLFKIDPSLFIMITSVIFLVISYIFLGTKKTKRTIIATLLYPIFISLTAGVSEIIDISNLDIFTASIIAGIISGISTGLILKNGFSSGGINIITQIIHKYKNVSLGTSMLISNGIIILCGSFLFGVDKAIYGVIVLYITSVLADRVIIGISSSKCFNIITTKEKEISNFAMNFLKNGVTEVKTKGGFTLNNKDMLMIVVPNKDYFVFKNAIEEIDQDVFYVVTDSYHVRGGQLKKTR